MGEKINVMYIFNGSSLGGSTQSLLDILTHIKEKVNPIVVMRDDTQIEDIFTERGICHYTISFSTGHVKIGSVSLEEKAADKRQSYKAALQLIPIIRKEKIQLIHINTTISYFGAIAALMTNTPYICHIRELLEEQFGCELINQELEQYLLNQADCVITISDYVSQYYRQKFGFNTIRMYDGLDIEKCKVHLKADREYKNIFLVAAAITPEKGQWDVIRALEIVVKRGYTDVRVIIVGSGLPNYLWALKKYIVMHRLNEYICIMPFQNDLSILRMEASYAITCSKSEALGRVTIEAMLAGHIVIGARSGATTELIGENEERGFLYELGNIDDLADAMIKVMQYPVKRKDAIVSRAQAYAEEIFDCKHYCDELARLYCEVISSYTPKVQDNFLQELKSFYMLQKDKQEFKKEDMVVYAAKMLKAFRISVKWLEIRQKNNLLKDYFQRNHINTIAIYGMAELGCRLYDELEGSEVEVKYLIDKNPCGMDKILSFAPLDKGLLDVDAVVVTVILEEKQLISNLIRMGYKKVLGLSDVIDVVYM